MALRRIDPLAAAVAALALALRVPLVMAALPGVGNSDEPLNISVGLRMASDGTLDAHAYRYPGFLYEVIVGMTTAFRAVGIHVPAHGAMRIENLGVAHTDSRAFIVAIRLVGVAASVATCLLVWAVVREVLKASELSERWSRGAAAVAAITVAVSPLAAANSAYATPDVYAGLAVALTLYGATRVLRGARYAELLCGLGVGIALGAKYLAAAVLPVLVAYVLSPERRRRVISIAGVAAVAAAVFALTTPGIIMHPISVLDGLRAEAVHYQGGHVGAQGGAPGYYLSALFRDQPLLLDAVAVAGVAIFRTAGLIRRTLIVAFAYAIPQFVLLAVMTVRFDRNLVPLTPALAVLAGVAVPAVFPQTRRRAVAAITVAAAFLPLASAVRLYPQLDEHSRVQAAAWVARHVPGHEPVAVESYGPWLDPARYHLVPLTFAADKPAVQARALILTEHAAGRFLSDAAHHPHEAAAYRALMSRYRLAARFTAGSWIAVYVPRGTSEPVRQGPR
ncbi:4-amino-4-deoxy-L-arabinose transferase and related glycosyltransferase of PMT family [Catenulispora acidiphila DSM 44928]|uniref:4-amino-4-deoxy-L-arabinose transferase and related glycosyltransferase of PMT family n=1 Tax=Catenulispora acidiphila (strain DSM 44928 / JCM 14897 / NBRC 102108 / NRRL B-24433 / ID139908) TaxID=479433 RepID=C7QCJ7_CATAD|nr:glycosyltransferase family 39 protein [Catenulispora acidiphila]ACU76460.1 4-amino-4-deoxy-L-arabinose transferase and related glycosyltransferase of PMT family [Catenulispora acidiphila DSM 44928]